MGVRLPTVQIGEQGHNQADPGAPPRPHLSADVVPSADVLSTGPLQKLFPSDVVVFEVVPKTEHRIDGHEFSLILHVFR